MYLLGSLSYEEVERLGRSIPEVHLARGQILYTPAHRSEILFLLLRGRVLIYKMVEGREFTVNVVRAGEMFGEAALTNHRHKEPTRRPSNPPRSP